jgi:hypothetical protein
VKFKLKHSSFFSAIHSKTSSQAGKVELPANGAAAKGWPSASYGYRQELKICAPGFVSAIRHHGTPSGSRPWGIHPIDKMATDTRH